MRLRTYDPTDADNVLALNQSNLDAVGPLDLDRLAWLVSMADDAIVADDGEAAGFALTFGPRTDYDSPNYQWFVERYAHFGYLDRVVIAPAHRRRGVGTLIYDRAEQRARQYGRLALEVYSDPPNTASLAFHAARGYVVVDKLGQPNGKTAAMFVKDL